MKQLRPILAQFPILVSEAAHIAIKPLGGGLINDTFAVGEGWILQRLHPIFTAEVNHDISRLTTRLRAAGLVAPTLVTTAEGHPHVIIEGRRHEDSAGVWRLMNRLPGRTLHQLQSTAMAASAGALVARFHAAFAGFEHKFHFTRPGAHDTEAHLSSLREAVAAHREHRLYDAVARVTADIEALWARQSQPPALPLRIGHGDLKVSNLLFAETGPVATALIDLDTMAWMSLDMELGDALRSWCNRDGEDAKKPRLDEAIFAAAIQGYGREAGGWVGPSERDAVVPGLLRISTELSARFAADALREDYFGWDATIAPSRGEHNLLRARNQLAFARQVDAAQGRLHAHVRAAFSS